MNPARPGAAYGYVDMGGWVGGQAEYVMVPYADFNALKFPDKAQALEKMKVTHTHTHTTRTRTHLPECIHTSDYEHIDTTNEHTRTGTHA